MGPQTSLLVLNIILLSFYSIVAKPNHNLIQQTCKNISETDSNVSYKFCINSLESDPRSHGAKSLEKLGLASIKLVRHNVTDTRAQIKEILKKNKNKLDPFAKECLDDCLQVYSDAIATIKEAIKDYKAKRYADSNVKLSSVIDASTTCEDGFNQRNGVVSPLTKRNKDTFLLSAISLSIINMLNKDNLKDAEL
ncbi:putative invertase inhibitor [Arachis duranensis]|uniref:Invertase inhibitor n=1 Tax=Arachis duranensis TaxID=130453 RepID=A0A6P4BG68_ARADU|nr:putative invertase inhibitor [Arachis duranensis]